MKNKPATIHGMAHVATYPTADPAVVGFEVRDTKGRSLAAAVNAWGLADIIEQCLKFAGTPIFAAATNAQTEAATPSVHTDASQIELRSGRAPKEVAATMKLGCLRLVVFLPLADVLRAIATLRQSIEQDTSAGTH
jgi:hypothetical protein